MTVLHSMDGTKQIPFPHSFMYGLIRFSVCYPAFPPLCHDQIKVISKVLELMLRNANIGNVNGKKRKIPRRYVVRRVFP